MDNGLKAKQSSDKFFTIEFIGVTVIVSSFLLLVCLIFGQSVLFEIGKEVQIFLLGLLGYLSYPVLITLIFLGFVMLLGRKAPSNRSKRPAVYTILILLLLSCLLTVITSEQKPETLSSYLNYAFERAKGGLETSVVGGAVISLITYYLVKNLTYFGAIAIFSVAIFTVIIIAIKSAKSISDYNKELKLAEINAKAQEQNNVTQQTNQSQNQFAQPNYQQPIYPQNQYPQNPYAQPQFNGYNGYQQPAPYQQNVSNGYERRELFGYQNQQYSNPTYANQDVHDRNMQILYGNQNQPYSSQYNDSFSQGGQRSQQFEKQPFGYENQVNVSSPIMKEEPVKDYTVDDSFSFNYNSQQNQSQNESEVYTEELYSDNFNEPIEQNEPTENKFTSFLKNARSNASEEIDDEPINEPINSEEIQIEEDLNAYSKTLIENMPLNYVYKKPPISLFKTVDNTQNNYEFELFKAEMKARILTTLKTFGVDTDIPRVFKGPAVTRFDIAIPPNVPMSKVTKLQNDLNLRIAAKSAIRMIAPVPNTSYVGIEVPNKEPDSVCIKDIIVSDGFINTKPFSLVFALGKDVIGSPVSLDIADMPHLLVTGTTGSGKSVCLNSLIISLISKYGPDELRFVIVDPKRVDLEPFKTIPHMMFGEIIEDVPTTNSMLTWAVEEMESRYRELAKARAKNIKDYNIKARSIGQKIMPRIVILMDEFADIMLQDKKGVATKVCLIAQKARAAGIHLVLAAQRPSVDIIEGPIKSNLPSRIVFRASSMPDSMTSLGEAGAEKLLGRGDCLYKTNGMLNVERVMGAYVSDEEMYAVIDYVTEHNQSYFDHNNWSKIVARVSSSSAPSGNEPYAPGAEGEESGASDNEMGIYVKAMRIGYKFGGVSASFLQRKLAIGFPRAGKIIDWLTDNGYITANAVGGKRQMILSKEAFEEKFGAE